MGEMSSTFFNRGARHAGFLIVAVVSTVVLASCESYNNVTHKLVDRLTPYHLTIEQGNFVSNETAAQLQKGMSRDQVKALLGTPLLADVFHQDRWDYMFSFRRGPVEIVEQRDLTVYFNGDSLDHWTGASDLPSELELLAAIDGDNKASNLLRQEREAKTAAAAAAASAGDAASAPAVAGAVPASGASGAAAQAPNVAAANAANAAVSIDATTARDTKPVPNGSQIPQPTIGGNVQTPNGQPQISLKRPPPPQYQGTTQSDGSSGLDRVLGASDAVPAAAPATTPSAAPPGSGSTN
jgi:outer membrane protein assembly factor BamE